LATPELEVVAQRPRVAILRHHQKGVLAARLAKAMQRAM
jgi:hypothetical protein